jgi:hypothetical protein
MTDSKRWRGMAAMVCTAALAGLAACGGGGSGGGSDPSSATATPEPARSPVPASTSTTSPSAVAASSPVLADCEMFPSSAIFNTRIDDVARFPVHPDSARWIALAGPDLPYWTDWGRNDNPADYATYYGMPINIVDGTAATTQWPLVSFDFASSGVSTERGYPHESDCAVPDGSGFAIARDCGALPTSQQHFPFPPASKVLNQGGNCNDPNSCGDHPVLIVEQGACRLWESYFAFLLSGQWYALATAAWDLKSLSLRPSGWTSASASGLPITPLLARAVEASSGEIKHALRVNFREAALARDVNWPARHAGGADNPGAIPFGALLRLKADFVVPADWAPQARALATAAKRYGLYVSDIGGDFYVQGEPNSAWDPQTSLQMKNISLKNMEFVDLKAVTADPRFSPASMAASW